jgi:hypothetical protein
MRQTDAQNVWRAVCLLALWAAGAMTLGGCATEPTRFSTGPVAARTFNFVRLEEEKKVSYANNSAQVHALIQGAIEGSLLSKGLARVETNGDVAVLYLIIISDGTSTETINDYFGYSDASYELQDKAHQVFAIEKRNRTAFNAGTLVIEIVNVRQRRVLWRNFVYRPILKDLPIEQRQVRLQQAVDEVFKELRITK